MQIKRCNEFDLNNILALERKYIECPWSETNLSFALKNENCIILKAEEDGEFVGYCGVEIVLDEGNILNVAVSEKHRRKGIASALISAIIDECAIKNVEQIFLEVNEHNDSAIALYQKHGFEKIAERKRYYGNDSAVIMRFEVKR